MSSSSGRWLRVPAELLRDGRAVVEGDGHSILLLRAGGEVHALANACPHEGNPLVEGEVLGDVLECAYHGWRFDLESGACLAGDGAARRYEAEERDGVIRVLLDQD